MPNPAKVYLLIVYLSAIGALSVTLYGGGLHGGSSVDPLGIIWFAAIALAAEANAVNFRIGSTGQVRSSLAFLPFLSGLTIFSTAAAVLMIVFVIGTSQVLLRRAQPWRAAFNVAQGALSGLAGAYVFHSIMGGDAPDTRTLLFASAFCTTAATFFLVNMFLSSTALALLQGSQVWTVFKHVVGPGGANLWYDLLATPLALVPVILYSDNPVMGVVLILMPLLLIQYSYLSKQDLLEANNSLLRALVKAIETRDPYTSGHSLRVATMARAIAADMGLRSRRLTNLDVAALLHDIGKIDPVFNLVLCKPFDLSPDERALIETHASKGADLLQSMRSVPDEVVLAVRHHHERYDGRGYPDGLSGESIPLLARIIMLCDSIDAMLSDRPYRSALTVDHVEKEIRRCSGTQFDPRIVSLVLEKDTIERAVTLIHADAQSDNLSEVRWS